MEKTSQKVFVMWFCLCIVDAVAGIGCRWEERQALLRFRERLVDPDNWLSTVWVGDDCCNWWGVGCSNETGHVLKLDLIYRLDPGETRGPLSGEIDPSLMDLKHLQYLDLGDNVFNGTSIPQFFGSMTSLRYLSLSNTQVTGTVPTQLGNLTNLRHLDLSSMLSLRADTLQWLANLSSLQYLDLSWVYLADATDWPLVFYSLPSLSVLRLSDCGLSAAIPSYQPNQNLTSISILDLSKNYIFSSTIPDWLFNISSLTELDLHNCNISDPIPNNIGNLSSLSVLNLNTNYLEGFIPWNIGYLCNLKDLDLSYNKIFSLELSGCALYSLEELNLSQNKLTGPLPDWLGNSRNLRYLNLGYNLLSGPIPPSSGSLSFLRTLILYGNNLNGSIPESLGQLSELIVLDLRFNSLEGVVSDAHFAKHARLEALFLSYNLLSLTMSSNWVPPFQLKNIHLGSCRMGPGFPSWLRTQREFSTLDISDAGISDQVPNWFWNLSSRVVLLNVSHNGITGELPSSLEHFSAAVIDLSSNDLHGPLPPMNTRVQDLYASNNSFSGDLHAILKETMQSLKVVLLSGNSLNGSIPLSICEMKGLNIIDLSNNLLSGEIPICKRVLYNWLVLNLASNNLQGPIPDWMCSLRSLRSLHLSDNSLHGEIPLSLQNCQNLIILDLGENKLTGRIPTWIGEQLSYLFVLRLRSNMFNGSIPPELSYLVSLQILDLAHNALSGTIPPSFKNLSAMTQASKMTDILPLGVVYINSDYVVSDLGAIYTVALTVATKGREFEYSHTLSLVMSLDLSENLLSGEFPEELMCLVGLQSLNLSGNQLTGKIPDKIGDMIWLETLDLSRNQLTGTIPWSITALTLLNHMNLSYNNLSGKIPSGNQLQTLTDPSIYESNDGLCGFPLSNTCPGAQPSDDPVLSDGEDFDNDSESLEFYISVGLGFLVGLCGVFGVLFIKDSWTAAYFELIDDLTGPIYMAVAMKLKRRF